MKKKVVALILSAMLVLGIAMGATLAWLTDTATVTNTFTPSDVDITLSETDNTDNTLKQSGVNNYTGNTYKMVPGSTLPKDPQVTVSADSEKCFVFVEISGSALTKTVLNAEKQPVPLIGWSKADGWNQLKDADGDDVANVYWRIVDPSVDTVLTFPILAGEGTDALKDGKVTISEYATKSDMEAIASTGIQMEFTAYAVQYENIAENGGSDADAWKAWGNKVTE